MCSGCVEEYLDGKPAPEMTNDMKYVAALITFFYTLDECSVGGPLHVQLDDYNLEDEFWSTDRDEQWEKDMWASYPPHVQSLAAVICWRMALLTIQERAMALDYGHYGDKSVFASH